jgi:pyrroline-5-carboxylate reductase
VAQRERLAEFAEAGIDTAVLALSCSPTYLPHVIEAFA